MAFWTDRQNIIQPVRPYRFTLQETGVDNLLCYSPGQNDDDEVVVPIENTAKPKIANKKTPTDINQFKE